MADYAIYFHYEAGECDSINVAEVGYSSGRKSVLRMIYGPSSRETARSIRLGSHEQKRALRDRYCEANHAAKSERVERERNRNNAQSCIFFFSEILIILILNYAPCIQEGGDSLDLI